MIGNAIVFAIVLALSVFSTEAWSDDGPQPVGSDQEFLALLDLASPQLSSVSECLTQGDLAGAKHSLAQHIRYRKSPRWTFDWSERPSATFGNLPAKDPSPEGWDYYHTSITLDWKGWKSFTLTKEDFSPKPEEASLSSEGKRPVGWNWIRYMSFNAQGWGHTPNPSLELYFDDISLVGPAGKTVIADFESESSTLTGLDMSSKKARTGKGSGLWANMLTQSKITSWNIPHDWTNYDRLEFWIYCPKRTDTKLVLLLDSDVPKFNQKAEDAVNKIVSRGFQGTREWRVEFKDRIDWTINPTEGDAKTQLWNECLNRHFHFEFLGQAYWETGDERYANALAEQWMDWIDANPFLSLTPRENTAKGCMAWQTLTTGIRLERVWPNLLYQCMGSPAFTDEVLCRIAKSVVEQARYLLAYPSTGNWLTEESMGLYTAGAMFPEFAESAEWRRTAIERLYKQLDAEVYPDGMEYELATGYNNWVVSNMTNLLKRAERNGLQAELPADFGKKLEKMYDYQIHAMTPNGTVPGLNDSEDVDVQGYLKTGYELFPHRKDFLFGSRNGSAGKAPAYTSTALPYCGHYIMRSGWDADASYLLFDSGPLGYGHSHEDKLHFVIYAFGRCLLRDLGNYSYDRSLHRRYVTSTPGHNTIMVDRLGQNRLADPANRSWPLPWDKPVPPGNDTRWVTDRKYDFVRGTYDKGYGPKAETRVTHIRRVLFVKPDLFVVEDTLKPEDENEHLYESLFHLNSGDSSVQPDGLTVLTEDQGESNLAVIPLPQPGLECRVEKDHQDTEKGWAIPPGKGALTAILQRKSAGETRFVTVLCPIPKDASCSITAVEPLPLEPIDAKSIGVKVLHKDGRSDNIIFNDEPDSAKAQGEFYCLRMKANGRRMAEIRDRR